MQLTDQQKRLEWLGDAVRLVTEAGIGPASQTDVNVLMMYYEQGFACANAVKSVFFSRLERVRALQGANDALPGY